MQSELCVGSRPLQSMHWQGFSLITIPSIRADRTSDPAPHRLALATSRPAVNIKLKYPSHALFFTPIVIFNNTEPNQRSTEQPMADRNSTTTNLLLPLYTLGDVAFKRSYKAAMTLIDAAVGKVLTGSKTHDWADTADGARATTTVTVTGAALGDFVTGVSMSVDLAGVILSGYVSAANTVTVTLHNETGDAVNLASGTLRVLVRKA